MKNNGNPVVVFASFGDNITPPQQAFNWIVKTYGTVEEIKRRSQVIVYISHSNIGHLGIFVSAKIARKEHKEIIASFDMLDVLPPGLYQMQIEEDPGEPGEYSITYVEKDTDDILAQDDGLEDEKAFLAVRKVSETADILYRTVAAPWIRMANTDAAAEALRQLHPLRVQRYLFSDLNPWIAPFKTWAAQVKEKDTRRPADENNLFSTWEAFWSQSIVDGMNLYRDVRDAACEKMFKSMYENPWMKDLDLEEVQRIVREQSRIVQTDADQAISSLPRLLLKRQDRMDARAMIQNAVEAIGRKLEPREQAILQRVREVLINN